MRHLTRYWGHVLIALAFVLVGVGSAHVDAISDYRQETVYAEWAKGDGLAAAIGSFMVAGHENRAWIPGWLPGPVKSMARLISDGWHVMKLVMLGAPVLLVAALVAGRYRRRIFERWWLEALVLVAGSYLCIGGSFFLLYHRLLHVGPGWWGL